MEQGRVWLVDGIHRFRAHRPYFLRCIHLALNSFFFEFYSVNIGHVVFMGQCLCFELNSAEQIDKVRL